MKKIILIGAGGQCRSAIDVIEQENKFTIEGVVKKKGEDKSSVLGYPVIGYDNDIISISEKYRYALVCIGQIKSSNTRKKAFSDLIKLNIGIPTIISPKSYVSKHSCMTSQISKS